MTKWKSKTKEEKNEYRRNYRLAKKEGTGGYNELCICTGQSMCEPTRRAYERIRQELIEQGIIIGVARNQ